jgi:hypothetical protein
MIVYDIFDGTNNLILAVLCNSARSNISCVFYHHLLYRKTLCAIEMESRWRMIRYLRCLALSNHMSTFWTNTNSTHKHSSIPWLNTPFPTIHHHIMSTWIALRRRSKTAKTKKIYSWNSIFPRHDCLIMGDYANRFLAIILAQPFDHLIQYILRHWNRLSSTSPQWYIPFIIWLIHTRFTITKTYM